MFKYASVKDLGFPMMQSTEKYIEYIRKCCQISEMVIATQLQHFDAGHKNQNIFTYFIWFISFFPYIQQTFHINKMYEINEVQHLFLHSCYHFTHSKSFQDLHLIVLHVSFVCP